jgi:hypothetical protein
MIQTSVASLRWLSPSARNDYRHQIGIVIGFVGIGNSSKLGRASIQHTLAYPLPHHPSSSEGRRLGAEFLVLEGIVPLKRDSSESNQSFRL